MIKNHLVLKKRRCVFFSITFKFHFQKNVQTLLSPVDNIYTKLGEECAQYGCGVDLFVFANNYFDLATVGEVCRISGGEIYKFNYFSVRFSLNIK